MELYRYKKTHVTSLKKKDIQTIVKTRLIVLEIIWGLFTFDTFTYI